MHLSLIPNGANFTLGFGHLHATANREALTGLARALTEPDLDWDWRVPLPGSLDVVRDAAQVQVVECLPVDDDEGETVTLSEQQATAAGQWIRQTLRANPSAPAHLQL